MTDGIRGIDHLYVETCSFERACAFWTALGFAVAAAWGGAGHRACRLARGTAAIVLAEAAPGAAAQGPTVHFALRGAEAVQARLDASADVDVRTPLGPTHWGTRWIRVADPDGNVWVLETGVPSPDS